MCCAARCAVAGHPSHVVPAGPWSACVATFAQLTLRHPMYCFSTHCPHGFKQRVCCGVQCSTNGCKCCIRQVIIGRKKGQHTPDIPSPLRPVLRIAHHLKAHAAVWLLQVFRDCAPSQVEGCMSTLEEQSQITPLWEVFFQLMCHPVPQVQHPKP